MRPLFSSLGVGRVKAAETDLIVRPYGHQVGGGATAVLVALPHNYGPDSYMGADEQAGLADAGYCTITPGPASPAVGQSFGNDAAIDSFDKAWTYATATLGCRSDRVFLVGMSMGGLLCGNWARTHTSVVAGIALVTPAVDLTWVHGLSAPYPTEVDAAYTDHAGYLAAVSTHSPVAYAASIASVPVRIWYSTDDTLAPLSQQQAFQTAHGNTTLVSLGAAGHNPSAATGTELADWFATL